MCLCGCDEPESLPQLKNNNPSNAFTVNIVCLKSYSFNSLF